MAADLDRAGRGSGGPAGREGVPAGPGVPPGSWGSFAGRDGVLQDLMY